MKKHVLLIMLICVTIICIGCGKDTKSTHNNGKTVSNTETVETKPVKEEPKLSAEERQQKINGLSQGMDIKNDDMTGITGYTAPRSVLTVDIATPQLEGSGVATIYQLAAVKDSKGQKVLVELFELNTLKPNLHQIDYKGLVMRSKDKTYTPEYNFNQVKVSSRIAGEVVLSYFNCPASEKRTAEIREALKTGYLKLRIRDRITGESFDRELSNEEIEWLNKVVQIYDLM